MPMFKWGISGIIALFSIVLLYVGFLSFSDASSLLIDYDFKNIFDQDLWGSFKTIFVVYGVFLISFSFLSYLFFNTALSYFSLEKENLKCYSTALKIEFSSNKVLYSIAAVIFLIGFMIRFNHLDRPIRYDESFTFLEYGRSYIGYISMNYSYPNNHILHSILVRISTVVFGDALWAIRLPAFLGGTLVMILTFATGRKCFGLKAGILALTFVAFSEWLIGYSVNARGYTLQTAVFLLVLFLSLSKRISIGRWLIIGVLHAIGFWVIPSYIFCLIVYLVIILLMNGWDSKLIFSAISTMVLSALFYLPAIKYSGLELILNHPLTNTYDEATYYLDFLKNIESIFIKVLPGKSFISVCILGLVVCTSFYKKTRWLSIGIIGSLSFFLLVIGKHVPARVFMFVLPIGGLLLSSSMVQLLKNSKSVMYYFSIVIPIFSWGVLHNEYYDYESRLIELPEVIDELKSVAEVGVISKIPLDYPVRYYLNKTPNLNANWNSFGTDTVYIITNSYYQQDLDNILNGRGSGYEYNRIKDYEFSSLFLGVKKEGLPIKVNN